MMALNTYWSDWTSDQHRAMANAIVRNPVARHEMDIALTEYHNMYVQLPAFQDALARGNGALAFDTISLVLMGEGAESRRKAITQLEQLDAQGIHREEIFGVMRDVLSQRISAATQADLLRSPLVTQPVKDAAFMEMAQAMADRPHSTAERMPLLQGFLKSGVSDDVIAQALDMQGLPRDIRMTMEAAAAAPAMKFEVQHADERPAGPSSPFKAAAVTQQVPGGRLG